MPGYADTFSGSIPEGSRFRFERHSTPCCPGCGGTEFDRCERSRFKPDHFGLATVRCADCGQWNKVHSLVENYESDYEFQEA